MNRSTLAVALCAVVVAASSAFAGGKRVIVNHGVQATVVPAGFVVVPYAVPVATPAYVGYLAPQAFSYSRGGAEGDVEAQAVPGSLVATYCAKCHNAEAAKRVDLSGAIDAETRLAAIRRVLADDPAKRMPKGRELDAETLGLLIQELSTEPPEAAAE